MVNYFSLFNQFRYYVNKSCNVARLNSIFSLFLVGKSMVQKYSDSVLCNYAHSI